MKKYIYLFILFLTTKVAFAQTSVQVIVSVLPPYQINIADYQLHPERILLKLINTENFDVNVQLGASLSSNNGVVIKTKDGFRSNQPIRISANSNVDVDAGQIIQMFDLSNLSFTGLNRSQFEKTGILPEGDYQLCVRAFNFRTLDPYSASEPIGCSGILPIYHIEPPIIINPISESLLTPLTIQNIIINWTTPVGSPPNIQYTLRIVEVQGNRNPLDAMLSNAVIPFFEQTYTQNTVIYGPGQPQLIKDKKYALMVTAKDPFGNSVFRNNGNSVISWFEYGSTKDSSIQIPADKPKDKPKEIIKPKADAIAKKYSDSGTGNCGDQCKMEAPEGENVNASIKVNDKIKVNNFTMTIIEITNNNGGKLSGKGTVPVPFINSNFAKLRVEFSGAEINESKQMMKGTVKALVKSGSPSLVPVGQDQFSKTLDHTKQSIQNILGFINNDPMQKITNIANQVGFELPLGIDSDPFLLAVTDVTFTPEQAYFSVATVVDIPENNDNFALSARNICMDNESSICGSMELYLAQDFNIDVLKLKLIGQKQEGKKITGTFMKLKKNENNKVEVEHFHVKAEYTFPNKSLINVETKQPLMSTFEFDAKNGWHDWKAELTVPEFYVDGAEDVKFNLAGKMATLDHSDLENPVGIPAPYKSTDINEPDIKTDLKTWHGLYFPMVSVKIPDIIKSEKDPNKGIVIESPHMLFTSEGFTANIVGTNLISIGDGSLGGWYASVDSIKLNFWKSTFKNSRLTGRLVLPPCGSEIENKVNQLDYKCLLTNPKDKPLMFQFTVVPKNNMQFKAFYAKVNINNTSQIIIANRFKKTDSTKTEFYAIAKLDGLLGVTDDVQKIPGIVGVKIPDLVFNNFKIMTDAPYLNASDSGVFKFNSPQKTAGGFSINFKSAGFIFENGSPIKIGMKFKGNMNLLGDEDAKFSLKAETTFGLYAKIEMRDSRPVWDGVGGKLEDVSFGADVDLGAIKIKGALKYYYKENPDDCGFVGALAITLPTIETKIGMKAQFGCYGKGESSFKYFNFDGLVDFGKTGIPMFAGISLYGLGGGLSYNMKPDKPMPSMVSVQNTAKPNDNSGVSGQSAIDILNSSPSGQKYIPSKGSFGLKATVLFGLTARNSFDADATFTINFNQNGGLADIVFDGNCRIVTDASIPMPDRTNKSLVTGSINVMYDFENKIFDMGLNAALKYPIGSGSLIKATGWLQFNVSPQGWFLYVGRPHIPCEINLMNIFTGKTYFEASNYALDPMPDVPQEIRDLAGTQGNNLPKPPPMPRTGNTAGFIHGSYAYFSAGGSFLFLYGHLKAGMGYDIAFKKYGQEFVCGDNLNPGANGWYATGQAYLGVNAAIGMDFGSWFGKVEIFEGGAVAVIMAGLPNPSWAKGGIVGYYNILGGMFSGNFNYKFEIGSICSPAFPTGVPFTLISDILPAKNTEEVEITEVPTITFNFPVTKGNFVYNEVTDNGITKPRFLKFDKSTIDISLSGGGDYFGNDKFKLERGKNNVLVLTFDGLLKPITTYTYIVRAFLQEDINQNGDYKDLYKNGKKLQEEHIFTFTTAKGLKTIPSNLLVNAYPLHSHKNYIDEGASNSYFFEFNKVLNNYYFDIPNASQASIHAIVYKNEIFEREFLVNVNGFKWEFNKFNLLQNSDYRVEFEVRQKGMDGINTSSTKIVNKNFMQIENIIANNARFKNDTVSNSISQIQGNSFSRKKGNSLVVSYLRFKTSAYKKMQEKVDNQIINKIAFSISNPDGPSEKVEILRSNTKEQNKTALLKLCNLNESNTDSSSFYTFNCPQNTVKLTDELFSLADVEMYNTNLIFKNGGRKNFNPLIDIKNYYDVNKRTNNFISEVTGVPLIKIKGSSAGIEIGNCGMETTIFEYERYSNIGANIIIPYKPVFTYNFIPPSFEFFDGGFRFVEPKPTLTVTNIRIGCSNGNQNIIFGTINDKMDSRVNPVFNLNANNTQSWSLLNSGVKTMSKTGGVNKVGLNLLIFKAFK